MTDKSAYVVAVRRTALGRVGGLHRSRRVEALAVPVVEAAIADAGLANEVVDEFIVGNATAGGNPARLIALSAGLSESVAAYTIDRQCASGLEAMISAVRTIAMGDANVIVAGGAESLSTAPWRIAKPRNLHQMPRFIEPNPAASVGEGEALLVAAAEQLARRFGIERARQDAYAMETRRRANLARDERRFIGEIVPLKTKANEVNDEASLALFDDEDMAEFEPFQQPDGTVTPGNASGMHDGAAMAVIVSQGVYDDLGKPPAMRLLASAAAGASLDAQAAAPIHAMQKALPRLGQRGADALKLIELSELSAAQAIVLQDQLGVHADAINPDGGALALGHPYGASGAVTVARLFTDMVRNPGGQSRPLGAATTGGVGGLGVAAIFEAVGA